MELGNIVFGNSRGNFPVERGSGFEEELSRLFDAYAPKRDNGWREYGVPYENDTFVVRSYYWGECDCGFTQHEFMETHGDECYQTALKKAKLDAGWTQSKYWLDSPKGMKYDEYRTIEDRLYKRLCKQYGLSYPAGCAVHCTCDYGKRFEEWLKDIGYPDGCKETCSTVLPNFQHKPSGYSLKWYKYPLRDAYASEDLNLKQFSALIDNCVASL